MLRSTPKVWITLAVILIITAGGAFFALSREKNAEYTPLQIGVMNMEKAIESHPNYLMWVELRQEEATLLESFNRQITQDINAQQAAMHESAASAFEQEFNARMQAKQDELQEKMSEKAQMLSEPLDAEMKAYVKQIEKEYQPQIFNLRLKLSILQMEEEQARDIIAEIEALREEEAAKIEAKSREMSQRLNEIMVPEIDKLDEELNRYASELSAELNARMTHNLNQSAILFGQNAQMPPELRGLEERINAKRQESAAAYETIEQEIKHIIIEIAVKNSLEAVVGDFKANISALDITDLVIAEFKK